MTFGLDALGRVDKLGGKSTAPHGIGKLRSVVSPDGVKTYSYDAVGNQITRPGGVIITYTPFDLPRTITQPGKSVSFGYDGDEQRIRKTTSTSETIYFEDLFEQITTAGGKEFRYYVQSPERTIAIVTHGGNEPGTKYLHVDHIGSTETITNENGGVVEKRSYDAFGASHFRLPANVHPALYAWPSVGCASFLTPSTTSAPDCKPFPLHFSLYTTI